MTLFDEIEPPPAQTEEAIRDSVLADLESRNAEILAWLRRRMVVIYRIRCEDVGQSEAFVTADDARAILDADRRFNGLCRNFLGALFRGQTGWVACGWHKSETPGSHANRLMRWKWVG